LGCDVYFNYESDYFSRIYGKFVYALDCYLGTLHVYSLKDDKWNYEILRELGIGV
jgi:hypothetical protein